MNAIIFSDLDRTIIPNGSQPESPAARPLLRRLASEKGIKLVYVSGRSQSLIQAAIDKYELPFPDFAVGDVGSTICRAGSGSWEKMRAWQREIAVSWQGITAATVAAALADLDFLTLQEAARQSRFKLSYYMAVDGDHLSWCQIVAGRLAEKNIRAALINSIDERRQQAFLDIVPENATKLHAVRFLLGQFNLPHSRAVFCGDSGNDLPVLTSGMQAVLVANATELVRNEAGIKSAAAGHSAALYLAKGREALNGNYSAGVLEGAAHFLPEIERWLENSLKKLPG